MKTIMLKKNYEFQKVFAKKNYYGGKYLEMFVIDNNKQSNYSVAILSTAFLSFLYCRHKIYINQTPYTTVNTYSKLSKK